MGCVRRGVSVGRVWVRRRRSRRVERIGRRMETLEGLRMVGRGGFFGDAVDGWVDGIWMKERRGKEVGT